MRDVALFLGIGGAVFPSELFCRVYSYRNLHLKICIETTDKVQSYFVKRTTEGMP